MQVTFPHDAAEPPASPETRGQSVTDGQRTASAERGDESELGTGVPLKLSAEILNRLCCPACKAGLRVVSEGLDCTNEGCGKRYPLIDGIPVLIDESRSIFTIASFLRQTPHFFAPARPLQRFISGCLPSLTHNIAADKALARMRECLLCRGGSPKVLVVGGGEVGAGVDALLDDPAIEVVHSDVSVSGRIDCICDGHDLPFQDASFDGVVIQAVLEHVLDPVRCVEEVYRVLKDGGLVYSDTPFVCQVHGRQFDFTRFTRLGHRRLFRGFREVSSGISGGPGTALGWTLRYFLLSFFTKPVLRTAVSGFSRLAFFWMKYFDYLLVNKPGALDTAFAFYFLGEKSHEVLADSDLLESYRGGH